MHLVVQIPCHNEEATLPEVLAEIPRTIPGVEKVEVLVIDDGSADETSRVAAENGADRVVRHGKNRGLAAAFTTGLETALKMGADVVVNTDGDNQYPGASIPDLLAPIVAGEADLVIGDRQTAQDERVPFGKKMMYGLGGYVVRQVTGLSVRDAPSGFRAMSRAFVLRTYLTNDFSYTLETICQAAEQRVGVATVPIRANPSRRPSRLFKSLTQYIGRSASILVRAYAMHNPLRIFAWLSVPFFVLGIGLGVRFLVYFIADPGYSGHVQSLILSAISLIVGVQIVLFGVLGDLVRTNRMLLQDIVVRVRRIELGEAETPSAGSDGDTGGGDE